MPAELEAALHEDEAARKAWNALTPGRRRGYAHMMSSREREARRERKAGAVWAMRRRDAADPSKR